MSPILGIWASQNYSRYALPLSFESIATTTVGAGGTSTITFSSIPSTYTHLQLRYIARFAGTSVGYSQPFLQFNSDTASNYNNHALYGTGSAAGASNFTATGAYTVWCPDSTTTNFGGGVVDILDYTNTNKNTTIRSLGGFNINSSSADQVVGLTSALWRNTAAITSIDIKGAANFAQYSHFALYGVKGD